MSLCLGVTAGYFLSVYFSQPISYNSVTNTLLSAHVLFLKACQFEFSAYLLAFCFSLLYSYLLHLNVSNLHLYLRFVLRTLVSFQMCVLLVLLPWQSSSVFASACFIFLCLCGCIDYLCPNSFFITKNLNLNLINGVAHLGLISCYTAERSSSVLQGALKRHFRNVYHCILG